MANIALQYNPEFLIQTDSLNKFYKLAINAHSLSGIFQREVTNKNYNELPPHEQEKVNTHVAKRIQEIERLVYTITDNKYYQTWIYKQLAKQTFSFPEDYEKVFELITHYHQVKNSGNFPVEYRNILIFETYSELHAIVSTYSKELSGGDVFYTAGNNPVIYDQDNVKVIQLNNYDDAEFLLDKTGWCVQEPDVFHGEYGPPFYLFVSGNKKIALLHVGAASYQSNQDDDPFTVPNVSLRGIHDDILKNDQAKIIMDALKWVIGNNYNTTIPDMLYKVAELDSVIEQDMGDMAFENDAANDMFSIFYSLDDSVRKQIIERVGNHASTAKHLISSVVYSTSKVNDEIINLVLSHKEKLATSFVQEFFSWLNPPDITAPLHKIHEIFKAYIYTSYPEDLVGSIKHMVDSKEHNAWVTDELFALLLGRIMRNSDHMAFTENLDSILSAIKFRATNMEKYFKIVFDGIIAMRASKAYRFAYTTYIWFSKNNDVNNLPTEIIELATRHAGPYNLIISSMIDIDGGLKYIPDAVWLALSQSQDPKDKSMLERILNNFPDSFPPVLNDYVAKNRPDLSSKQEETKEESI